MTNSTSPPNVTASRESPTVGVKSVGDTRNKTGGASKFENRIISMSLYGSDSHYTEGAIENGKLIDKVFPGWKLRIYLTKPEKSREYAGKDLDVPSDVIKELEHLNVDLVFMNPLTTGVKPMMWRFPVASDVTVERFIVRDADNRLIPRDAAEVELWIQSGKAFHCIRDHPFHSGWVIAGGLWGGVPSYLKLIVKRETFRKDMENYGFHYRQDILFLKEIVWPQVKDVAYCSDSVSCDKWESSHPFATNRSENLEFVGERIVNGHRKRKDVDVLRTHPTNPKCIPGPDPGVQLS